MLIIRDAQIDSLRRVLEEDFQRRLRRRIREAIPETVMDDGRIETGVASAVRQARDCGFLREIDIARFVETVFLYLGGVPTAGLPKPVRPILYAYRADPDVRLRRFEAWCRNHHPEEPR